jgi:Mg2+/citrate symporter
MLRVVLHRHILPHISNSSLPRLIQLVTCPFTFEAAEEAFYWGVVTAVTFPSHTTNHSMLLQQCVASMTGMLAAKIRMMD